MTLLTFSAGILLLLISVSCDPPLFEDSPCSSGICTKIHDCPEAFTQVQKLGYHNFPRCGFSGFVEIVCCPPQRRHIDTLPRRSQIACGKYKKDNPLVYQIAGGVDADAEDYPFIAALSVFAPTENQYKFVCGGILISENYVLTAAHCLWNLEGDVKIVSLGVGKVRRNFTVVNETTDYKVATAMIHPEFNRKKRFNDLGLIKLEKKVEFQPACLHSNTSYPEELVILGWGEVDKPETDILQKGFVSFFPPEECKKKYRNSNEITENQVCARGEKSDICGGDSGGPLLTRFADMPIVVGVASFGQSGCMGGSPSVYTSVSKYLNWIEKIVWGGQ